MDYLQQTFSVRFEYRVFFTEGLFDTNNPLLKDFFTSRRADAIKKVFFVIDSGVAEKNQSLEADIHQYFQVLLPEGSGFQLVQPMTVPGGESAKNNEKLFYQLVDAVDRYGIDRHSYVIAIGGGSVLDLVGYAAAVSHRGIRHIRIPTTVLSQNDSGVGVKNGINYKAKKNFLGSFAPPVAVFNDYRFLTSLTDEEWRSGMSEAVKVALIKDKPFFDWLQQHAARLAQRDLPAMKYLVKHCAQLHMEHIAGGDPFELGSSRPLDFGHWSAHKLEQLSGFTIRHGEAVALGIALDSAYSFQCGWISESNAKSIINLLRSLGFAVTHPLMEVKDPKSEVLKGLEEFREHLGGQLTIMLLRAIGRGEEVHALEGGLLAKAGEWLKTA